MFLFLGIAFVSAAGLAFEITLTRVFAIAQGYHFGFLAISLALLGLGASGTVLALHPTPVDSNIVPRLGRLALVFSLSLVFSYLAVDYLPFDSYRITLERIQLLYLVLYYLALVVPFFLGGLILGLPLVAMPYQIPRVYAANLVGSGLGCVAALGALAMFGGPGVVFFSAMLGALGALVFSISDRHGMRCGVAALLVAVFGLLAFEPLSYFDLKISPYKSLSQTMRFPDARVVWRAWNAISRVEVVESSAVRSAPGLSLTYRSAMPTQRALFEDAESISPLTNAAPLALLDALPVTLAYQLRPNARVLMLKPGGGLEVLAALNAGASEIIAVEDNPLIARAAQEFAPNVFDDPRVHLVAEGARSYTARSRDEFDVVHLALSDPFRPVSAGAYALGENYMYTREAFSDYMNHLSDTGILMVSRWLQLPPTEEARVGALAVAALEGYTLQPRQNILVLRSFSTVLLVIKRTPFTRYEIEIAKGFAAERQYDWIAYPGMRADESNRFNVLRDDDHYRVFQQLLVPNLRTPLFESYSYDITPPTDDRPFFFHFFKWEQTPQVLQLLGKVWQPFGGSGYLILFALLTLTLVASGGLILLPLLGAERGNAGGRRLLVYFACLGMGFLFVEIPLIQRFILFLDHPVYAFATVIFTLLIASGAASSISERLPHRTLLGLLVLLILVYPPLLPGVFRDLLGYPLYARVLVSCVLLAPIGFLMGIPFPRGLALLNHKAPGLVPLAWGVNGCTSVISSILAMMGAMTWGLATVMVAGAGAYALALAAVIFPGSAAQKPLP